MNNINYYFAGGNLNEIKPKQPQDSTEYIKKGPSISGYSINSTGVTTEFKDNLEDVAVTITKTKATNGKANSIVRVKNNNPGKVAVVYVIADENIIYMPAHLASGGTVNVSAGSAEQISYYVIGLLPEEAKDPGLIQLIKDQLRKKVFSSPVTKGGAKGKTLSAPCMCIR